MRAKLILSFLLVILSIVAVNAVFYFVIDDPYQRLWISIIAGIAVGMTLGTLLARNIAGGISNLAEVAREIADGDLTKEVRVAGDRELVALAEAFRSMVGQLRTMVTQVQSSAGSLSGSAASLSGTAQQMSTSGSEISSATEHIAKGAELQVEVVERAARRIKEGAASIERIAARAREVADAGAAAGSSAERGGAAAASALEKMLQVFQRLEGSTALVHGFGERTSQIGRIVDVISGISEQTNLLALNAAIEAAHAGEYGRGFAVVADEIRKLSEKTRRSAEEITGLVGTIAQESAKVLATMESGTSEIRDGRDVIGTVRAALEEIVRGSVAVAGGVQDISKLAAGQAQGAEEMVRATDEISRIAEDNAAATEEASAATEEMTASLEQMAVAAQELARLADELRRTASRFRVGEGSPAV